MTHVAVEQDFVDITWFKLKDVCKLLSQSKMTITKLIQDGDLVAYKDKETGIYMIKESDLRDFTMRRYQLVEAS